MSKNQFKINGNIIDVVQRRIFKGEITVDEGKIISIIEKQDVEDCFILPGLIDAHVHIESSMLVPSEFARLAVKHGTVATVSDPHEIANVLGIKGVDFMIENGKTVPLKFHFGAPSCVPATSFETSGYKINSKQIDTLLQREDIYFLSEMMNFPGVIHNDKEVNRKIKHSRKHKKPIDGHAPGLSGKALAKYASAGITTDHECTSIDEALEKIRNGIKIQIREGSAAKNFEALYSLIDSHPENVMLCKDDSHPDDLKKGHINEIVKKGIAKGLDLINLLRATTVNPVEHYGLNVGLLQTNDPADFMVIDNINDFNILQTYIDGNLVFDNNKVLFECPEIKAINNFKLKKVLPDAIKIKNEDRNIRIIEAFDGELFTKEIMNSPTIENDYIVSDTERDFLKIVVINRYNKTAKPVVGFIKNFGLKSGAIAGSIAHDSHNVIAVGVDDSDILNAINLIVKNKGGLSLCNGNTEMELILEVAGLMSVENGETVAKKYEQINNEAKKLGATLNAPFMTLSFMALLVIPELKIGDQGLFDGNTFLPVSLFV